MAALRALFALCLIVAAVSARSAGLVGFKLVVATAEPDSTTPPDATTAGVPYTKPTNIPPRIPASCDGQDYLMIPRPGNCSWYVVCDARHPVYVMPCPAGLEFDYQNQLCNYPWIANCGAGQ